MLEELLGQQTDKANVMASLESMLERNQLETARHQDSSSVLSGLKLAMIEEMVKKMAFDSNAHVAGRKFGPS